MKKSDMDEIKQRLTNEYIAPLERQLAHGNKDVEDQLNRWKIEVENIELRIKDLEKKAAAGDWQAQDRLTALYGGDVIEESDPDTVQRRWE